MLKNYKDFLNEAGLDLGDLGGGGDEKKEKAPDPAKEIAKAKEKKRKKAAKERAEELDSAEAKIKKQIEKTPSDFQEKFKQKIFDALDDDDRVKYHDLILDIQSFEIPKAKEGNDDEVEGIAPIIKVLQDLNKNEYKG